MRTVWSEPALLARRLLTGRALMCAATLLVTACTDSPPSGLTRIHSAVTAAAGTPDPTLLPVADRQPPNVVAYTALNVPGQPAGFSYNDPVSGVKIWKVTSSTVPASNAGAGHDYADGPNQVSRGWGPNNDTHTILIRGDGMAYHLVDFTRGVGFSNYRILPPVAQPIRDLAFTFSSVAGQERIAYVINGGQLKRFNTSTMLVEPIGRFPLSFDAQTPPVAPFGWLHQDKNDVWFTGLLSDQLTAFAWNSQTGQFLTHFETWLNEPRLERDGRYIALTNGNNTFQLWDLATNTFGPVQSDPTYWLAHNANLRGQWVTTDNFSSAPSGLDRYFPSAGSIAKTRFLNNSAGYDVHHAGNWVQSDAELVGANLNKQWSFISGFTCSNPPWQSQLLWQEAIGVVRSDELDPNPRFLLHHYSRQPVGCNYYTMPWGTPSPDGKVVIFNSSMNLSGRYDLFVAEMPLGGSPPPPPPPSTQNVVWTNLTNVTVNGNSVTKTSGCEGCSDAGPISSQTMTSGNGYVEFQLSANTFSGAAGLSNGSTDNTRDDIDFAIARAGGVAAEVRENGIYKAETLFDGAAVFRVEVVNGVVQYKKNGTVFYTSTKVPTYPLLLDTWIGTLNASVSNAVISGLLN